MEHIRSFDSFVNEATSNIVKDDFAEVVWKMDKWMPEDEELQNEYYSILDDPGLDHDEKVQQIQHFIEENADEYSLFKYMSRQNSIQELAKYIVDSEKE